MFVPLSIKDHLDRAATVFPQRVGVVDEPNQEAAPLPDLTYERLQSLARAQAAGLDALGVDVGARVAIVSQNAARMLVSFFGVSGWGRILVPINFRLNRSEIQYIVEHSGAEVLLLDPGLDSELEGLDVKHRFVFGKDDERVFLEDRTPVEWQPVETATATINYTSGTTARPKGVQLTHRNLWLNAATLGWHSQVDDRDVYLHTLPMFHANGWGMPFAVTAMGGRHIVLGKIDGTEILHRVEAHGVTLLCAAPAVLSEILNGASHWPGEPPGRGRVRVITAGAPPPTRTIERIETELGWEVMQLYGLTETAPLLTFNRAPVEWDNLPSIERAERLNRAGPPALGVRLGITEDDEVVARSSVVMEGYWEQPEATAEAIQNGWFYTGDGGSIDDDNYLTIQDRKKDVIISGGENVSSLEVEDALFDHPDVEEAAVIGIPSQKWGETVTALVVLKPDATASEQELIDHCRERLAHYKCPTSVEFRKDLPRTATGKLQKFRIREPYWKDQPRRVN